MSKNSVTGNYTNASYFNVEETINTELIALVLISMRPIFVIYRYQLLGSKCN